MLYQKMKFQWNTIMQRKKKIKDEDDEESLMIRASERNVCSSE